MCAFFSISVPAEEKTAEPGKLKPWRIWKNLIVICVAWILLFTAFQGLFALRCRRYSDQLVFRQLGISNLQSSLNVEGNVGLNSMAIIYAFLITSSALLPHPMVILPCRSDLHPFDSFADEHFRHEMDDRHQSVRLFGVHCSESVRQTGSPLSSLDLDRSGWSTAVDIGKFLRHPNRNAPCGKQRSKIRNGCNALLWNLLRLLSNE